MSIDRYAFDGFAMSNLHPSNTGVEGAVIWISVVEFGGGDSQHGPRIKVVLGSLLGKTTQEVVKFVNKNRDALLR